MPDGGATNIAKLNIHPVSTPSYYLQRMEPLLPNAIQNPHPHSDGTESTTVRMSETSDEPAKQPPIRTTWNHGGDEATKNGKGRPFVKAPSHCYIIIAPSGHIVLLPELNQNPVKWSSERAAEDDMAKRQLYTSYSSSPWGTWNIHFILTTHHWPTISSAWGHQPRRRRKKSTPFGLRSPQASGATIVWNRTRL